jgi:phosphate uptake regulator
MNVMVVNTSAAGSICSQLMDQTAKACSISREAVAIVADSIATCSPSVLEELRMQERELDRADMEINAGVAEAIATVSEHEFHELLVCLKFALGLERIGALLLNVGNSVRPGEALDPRDARDLIRMVTLLEKMIYAAGAALTNRILTNDVAMTKLSTELDQLKSAISLRHENAGNQHLADAQVLFMAQSLQMAGDHAKYLAEQVALLITGNTATKNPTEQDEPVKQVFLDWIQCRERNIRRSAIPPARVFSSAARVMHLPLRPFRSAKRTICR